MEDEDQNWDTKRSLFSGELAPILANWQWNSWETRKYTYIDTQIQQIKRAWIWLIFSRDLKLPGGKHGHNEIEKMQHR